MYYSSILEEQIRKLEAQKSEEEEDFTIQQKALTDEIKELKKELVNYPEPEDYSGATEGDR